MNISYPESVPPVLLFTIYTALGTALAVVFLRKRFDPAGVHYLVFIFPVFLWGIGFSNMLRNDLPAEVAKSWGVFSQIAALFIHPTWFHFVTVYTEKERKFKIFLWVLYGTTALILLSSFMTHEFVSGFQSIAGIKYYPSPGYFYKAFTAIFVATIIYSFCIFFDALGKMSPSKKRENGYWLCWISLLGFTAGPLAFLPVYGIPFQQYNLLALSLWQVGFVYALITGHVFTEEP